MSDDLVARFAHFIELLKLFGPALREPHTKALGDGLFEARLKGKETIARIFFAYEKGRIVIMLHGFIKKSQKTPLRELECLTKLFHKAASGGQTIIMPGFVRCS